VLLAGQANDHHWWDGVREDFHTVRSTVTWDDGQLGRDAHGEKSSCGPLRK
jgi:hypothetical protein